MQKKLIRITTVPISLDKLLEGQLSFMNKKYQVIAVSSNALELEKIGKKEGVAVYSIALTRKITPLKDLMALLKLYWYLKKEQPFIVHTHTPKAGTVGMIAAKLAGVPIRLHTVAGLPLLETTGFKRKILNIVEKITYSCATKVYPNSKGLKEIIIENNFTNSTKLKVLANGSSNGIDTSFFNPQLVTQIQKETLSKQLGIQQEDFVFVFIGRLVGDKGINELIAAFKYLQSKFPSREGLGVCKKDQNSKLKTGNLSEARPNDCKTARLLLVGPLETDLDPLRKNTLQEIEKNPNIISVGFQQDVRPYFAISDCLVFPSYREGFPNVVMQAGAMGLPSIVSNINGCNEIIKEGENGWIIPVKDTAAILNTMENCLTNSEQFNKVKENARQLIVDRYEQKIVWDAILEEYKALEKDH